MGALVNAPPNDVRHFVHKKLLKFALPAVASFIPGAGTALSIAKSLTGGGGTAAAQRPAALRNLGLTDARRRAITRAGQAAQARGDHKEAAAFLRELGSQGALVSAPTRSVSARPSALRDLGLTDARRRAITKAMGAATARGDAREASAFLRELGAQGALRPSSIPPQNPFRERVIQAKPLPPGTNLRPRARARVPQIEPQIQPSPGVTAMPAHRKRDRFFNLFTGNGGGDECLPGTVRGPGGFCIDFSAAGPGGDPFIQRGVGVTMGRYGPAYEGNSRLIQRTTCLPGDLVGNDGLCYNRKSLTNKERMWPRGRQPLLTGGEMRAISVASRAAKKFERTQKRLQQIGMIKKPRPQTRRAAGAQHLGVPPHQHQISSGG